MRDHTQPGALPLRPLTTGELLDAAVVLLRARATGMILLGAMLALGEQAILFPLRRAADVDSSFLPGDLHLAEFGVLVIVGIFTETFCITWLGGVASSFAPRALLGPVAPRNRHPRGGSAIVVAIVASTVCAATAWTFLWLPVPLQVLGLLMASLATAAVWPIAYGLLGLVAPAVVVDDLGPGRALLRSIRLAARNTMRVGLIRVLGYVVWLFIRLGVGIATITLVEILFTSPSPTVDNILMGGAWLIVNALAYPVLGCLDVALHLDARMRTEGLDIALRRSVRRGVATDDALAVPR